MHPQRHHGDSRVGVRPAQRIHVKDAKKSFSGRKVVDIPELTLGTRGIEGLIGPNGAGKTTLMNLITRKLPLDSGEVVLHSDEGGDVTISALSLDRTARLGIVRTNQIIEDFETLTIMDSLLLALANARQERFYKLFSEKSLRDEMEAEIQSLLEYFHFENPKGRALSAGEKKLLDIVRCLVLKPRFLLMDEPTAGLPEDVTRAVMDRMVKLATERAMSILIVEHNLNVVWEICELVHFMAEGEILMQGSPDEVRNNSTVIEKYLGSSYA